MINKIYYNERLRKTNVAKETTWRQELISEEVSKRSLKYEDIVSNKKTLEQAKIEYMQDLEENIENIVDDDYLNAVWRACLEYAQTERN